MATQVESLKELLESTSDKPLVSASRSASFGRNGWITQGGGYLIPDDSKCSRTIKSIIEKEAATDSRFIKLYEEKGVYNFYMNVGSGEGKFEHIPDPKPDLRSLNLKNMSRDELIEALEKLKLSGFLRQPKA